MESQPQNPEFRINPENFYPCVSLSKTLSQCLVPVHPRKISKLTEKLFTGT